MTGTFRFPTVFQDTVLFVSEDDLWRVPRTGGRAERLTAGLGPVSHPRLSPDGALVAFSGAEEGAQEVYVMDATGGPPRRLTWLGGPARVVAWSADGRVVFASPARSPHTNEVHLHAVSPDGGAPERLPWGVAHGVAFGPEGQVVLCRFQEDIARWKRYRGGRTGELWIARDGSGAFEKLLAVDGNVAGPVWRAGRIWFVSDHAFHGNLFSVLPDGTDLRQETGHTGFTVRWPDSDGQSVVYALGGALWCHDGQGTAEIPVAWHSPRTQLQRRFVNAARYVQDLDLHPEGHTAGLVVRGRLVVMGNWEGAVRQLGRPIQQDGVAIRRRLVRWLHDSERIVSISDEGGEEAVEVHRVDTGDVRRIEAGDLGRPIELEVDPTRARVALTNHRHEIALLDLQEGVLTVLDRSESGRIGAPAWSPGGRWLAWSRPEGVRGELARIRLYDTAEGRTIDVTDGRWQDVCPSFDPDGQLLYFLSHREFDPVYDNIYFDLNFPRGMRPYAVTLRGDLPDPFLPVPRPLKKPPAPRAVGREPLEIDLDGLSERVVPFPVPEGRYESIIGLPGGRALLTRAPLRGSLDRRWYDPVPRSDVHLLLWEPEHRELLTLSTRISSVRVDRARQTAIVRAGNRLRVLPAAPDKGTREELRRAEGARPSRRSGWLDLSRIRVAIEPRAEWRQIFHEAWRLMRDHFWTADMGGVDWEEVRDRYAPLVERVGSRSELSDVIWEMQGELGTSHAYELGGDYRSGPRYPIGSLAADTVWDPDAGGWRVTHVVRGDPGDPKRQSPLLAPGVGVREGHVLLAIHGAPLDADTPPEAALVHQADQLVELTVRCPGEDDEPRIVTVRALRDERPARYREWVLANRRAVHEATGGRAGYVHIPNMGPTGYAEFHRDYLAESTRPALLVDVRYNGGGHVSELLLEKLVRRRVGYTVSRWGQPAPYPRHSVLGPMVCLTNEMAGSDGDIFSHVWKLYGLGPLVGTRTWGGVIGIWPRHLFVDQGVASQPEFSKWFEDVAWSVENRGTDPDIEVVIRPGETADGRDPQLERAIAELLALLEQRPPALPTFDARPHRGPPPKEE